MLIDPISGLILQGDSKLLVEVSASPLPLETARVERYGNPDPREHEGTLQSAVLADLREKGRRPATYSELARYAEQYPEAQFVCYIVALGQFFLSRDEEYVATLCSDSGLRKVTMFEADMVFGAHFGFLSFPMTEAELAACLVEQTV